MMDIGVHYAWEGTELAQSPLGSLALPRALDCQPLTQVTRLGILGLVNRARPRITNKLGCSVHQQRLHDPGCDCDRSVFLPIVARLTRCKEVSDVYNWS
jgi:hypothetical protein